MHKFSKFNQLVDVGSNIHTCIYGAVRLCAVEFIDASECEWSSIVHLSQATSRINNVFQTSHDHHITKTDVSFLQSMMYVVALCLSRHSFSVYARHREGICQLENIARWC